MTLMNADVRIHLVFVIREYPRHPRFPSSFYRNSPVCFASVGLSRNPWVACLSCGPQIRDSENIAICHDFFTIS